MNLRERTIEAFAAWGSIAGLAVVQNVELKNTLGTSRRVLGILKPENSAQIPLIVKIANQFEIPLFTVSTGRNWGYGSSLPALDDCVILNLEGLSKILHFDPQAGTVTVEPGVTQQLLHEYIVRHDLPFMVPTTGAGPTCSLLGNALERGYGITPEQDHFAAIINLKAVLPDGSIYQSALSEMGGHRSDAVFKWNVGPFVDGLFAQGNFGIVTQATLALARRPDHVGQFLIFVKEENFEDAIAGLRTVKQKLGSLLGGVNIMNKRRLLAMVEDHDVWTADSVMSEMELRSYTQKRSLPDWAVLGGVYTPRELRAGAEEVIRQVFTPFATRILFVDRRKVKLVQRLLKILPLQAIGRLAKGMSDAMNILEGIPSQVALPLAYMKNRKRPSESTLLSPDADGCGLIWFSPLMPIDAVLARDFTQEVTRVCIAHAVEPLVTLTAISERCFDATIPLVFDGSSDFARKRTRACFDALIEVALEFGLFPYRLDTEATRRYFDGNHGVAVEFTRRLKDAIDPKGILSPGRYSNAKDNALE